MKRLKAFYHLGVIEVFGGLYAFGGFPKQLPINVLKLLRNIPQGVKDVAYVLKMNCVNKCEIAQSMLGYVITSIRWVDDWETHKALDYWERPEETLKKGQADCEGKAVLLYCLLRCAGFEASELKITGIKDHWFLQCLINNEWHTIDQVQSYFINKTDVNPKIVLVEFNENGVI